MIQFATFIQLATQVTSVGIHWEHVESDLDQPKPTNSLSQIKCLFYWINYKVRLLPIEQYLM
jgi:hypothetical protein